MGSFLYLLIHFKWKIVSIRCYLYFSSCTPDVLKLSLFTCIYCTHVVSLKITASSYCCCLWKTSKVSIFNSVWKSKSVISASGAGSISISKIFTTSLVGWLNISRKTASILTYFRHDNCAAVHRTFFLDKNCFFLSEVMLSTGPTTPQAALCTSILSRLAHVIHTTYTDLC